MKKQNETDNQRHESTIDKYFEEPQTVTRHGLRKTRKKESICRLQLRRLEMQTKTETKDLISILLTTVKSVSSQTELLNQCKGMNSFARSFLQQLENS